MFRERLLVTARAVRTGSDADIYWGQWEIRLPLKVTFCLASLHWPVLDGTV